MKTFALILALAGSALAQDQCAQNWVFAGVGINGGTHGSVSGVGAYGKHLASVSGHCIDSVSAVNVTGGVSAPTYTFSTGAMVWLLQRPEFALGVGGDLGIAQSIITAGKVPTLSLDTLTQFAKSGGVIVNWRKLPKFISPAVSLAAAYRYQPTGGANGTLTLGWAWSF